MVSGRGRTGYLSMARGFRTDMVCPNPPKLCNSLLPGRHSYVIICSSKEFVAYFATKDLSRKQGWGGAGSETV